MRPVDKLLLAYVGFVTVILVTRESWSLSGHGLVILLMHGLLVLLVWLFTRLDERHRLGRLLHDFYPLLMLLPFYGTLDLLNGQLEWSAVLEHDAVIQRWEALIFGGQPSYQWIRSSPSTFWSGVLHLSYSSYYAIILGGPILLTLGGQRPRVRSVVFSTMLAFIACYVVFLLYPVAGPYYAFPHPTGPVREVWSARLVYGVLADGSSFGAAFPSSHVAATVAATLAVAKYRRRLGIVFAVMAILLTIATVYCQMHYAIDAIAGVAVGVAAWMVGKNRRRDAESVDAETLIRRYVRSQQVCRIRC